MKGFLRSLHCWKEQYRGVTEVFQNNLTEARNLRRKQPCCLSLRQVCQGRDVRAGGGFIADQDARDFSSAASQFFQAFGLPAKTLMSVRPLMPGTTAVDVYCQKAQERSA